MALGLLRESFGPRVELLGFGGRGPATDDEREEIARLAVSRATGSDVVVVTTGRAGEALPAELAPLAVDRGIGLGQDEWRGWRLLAGRGRGRVFATAGEIDRARELARRLADPQARAAIERTMAQVAGAIAKASAWLVSRDAALDELDGGPLIPAEAGARKAFGHEVAIGGETCLESATLLGDPSACFGVLIRGRESFGLELRRGGRPLERAHLVLLRRVAEADRGAVLRVELDDEDLGPWRLGERGAVDTLAVPSDLLAGRARVRVAATPEEGREVASILWRFAVEPELDGIGLTELEPTAIAGRIAPRDRDFEGELLAAGGRAFLHGLALAPQDGIAEASWSLPSGYRRLELAAALGRDRNASGDGPRASARLEVVLDSATAATLELVDALRSSTVPLGSARALTLRVRGGAGAPTLLLDPALLR